MKKLTIITLIILTFSISCKKEDNNNPAKYNNSKAEIGNEIGNKIPDFVLEDYQGNEFKIADKKGKVLFIKYWSPTCGSCLYSMPETNEIYNDYKNQGVEVLTITSYSSINTLNSTIEKYNMQNLTNLKDKFSYIENNIKYNFGSYNDIRYIPYYLIIDKYGIIQFTGNSSQSELLPILDECCKE